MAWTECGRVEELENRLFEILPLVKAVKRKPFFKEFDQEHTYITLKKDIAKAWCAAPFHDQDVLLDTLDARFEVLRQEVEGQLQIEGSRADLATIDALKAKGSFEEIKAVAKGISETLDEGTKSTRKIIWTIAAAAGVVGLLVYAPQIKAVLKK